MKEIKFRAIISDTTTIYFTLVELANETKFSFREVLRPWLIKGNLPNQYIGVKDKNDIEIYEGDIVRTDEDDWIAAVEYADVDAMFYCHKKGSGFSMLCNWNEFEVIGNIYENPELLD